MSSWFGAGCRPCSGANPEADTVKVNMVPFENGKAGSGPDPEEIAARLEAEISAREEAELEERRRAEEELRRQKEEEAAARAAAAAAAAAAAEEERLRQEQEVEAQRAAAEAARVREEQRAREEAEAKRRREAEEAARLAQHEAETTRIEEFLTTKGFAGINAKRKSMMKTKYPIHSVVKLNDTTLASLLLKHKADLSLKDSSGQTAMSIAQKFNKNGSHEAMIGVLQGA